MATPFPFSSGAVLTAAQMNAITTLPITAKTASATLTAAESVGYRVTMSNASATTITINSAVYAVGDEVFIANIGAGSTVLTAGSGVTLSTAGSLTIVQNQGGTLVMTSSTAGTFYPTAVTASSGGLVFLSAATFTTASSVSLAANTFSATYRNYLLNINITANTVDSNPLLWRGRTSGTDNSSASYNFGLRGVRFSDGAATTGGSGTSATSARLAFLPNPLTTGSITAVFFAPQLSSPTSYVTNATGRGVGDAESALQGGGYFSASTSFDALSFFPSSGTISGTYEVYGYAIS